MKKNNKVIIISIVVILIIVGGIFGFYKYKENKIQNMVNKGVEYLNQKEYEKAITAFDFVLEEKSNDTEALQLKGIIGKYLEAKKLFDNGNIEEANKLINEIGEEGSNYKEFQSDINNLKEQITTYMKKIKEINDYINKAKELVKEKKYNDAKNIIEKLEKDKLNIKEQTEECFKNLNRVLKEAGLSEENVVKVNVYLTGMKHFDPMNEVYKTKFTEPFPARTCVAVYELPLGADVEIEVIAKRQ